MMKKGKDGRIQICTSLYPEDLQSLDDIKSKFYPSMSRSQIIRLAVCYMLYELEKGEAQP